MTILAGVLLVTALATCIKAQGWLQVNQTEYFRSDVQTNHAGALDSCSNLSASLAIFENDKGAESNIARVLNGTVPAGSQFYAAVKLGSTVYGNGTTECLTTSSNSSSKSLFSTAHCNESHRYLCMRTVGASWGAWGSWQPCDNTCRPAEARRLRECKYNSDASGTNYCKPITEHFQTKPCNQDYCDFANQKRVNLTQCNATCERGGQELQHFACAINNKIIPDGCRWPLWVPCHKTCVASTTTTSGFITTNPELTTLTSPTTYTTSGTGSQPLIAGILIVVIPSAIGGLIVLVVLLVLGLWFIQRLRRSNKMSTSTPSAFSNSNGGSVELVTQVEIVENRHVHTYDSTPNENEYDTPPNDRNNGISPRQRNLYDRVTEENEYDVAREDDDLTMTTTTSAQRRLAQSNGSHNYTSPHKRRIPAVKYEDMSMGGDQHYNSLKSSSSTNNGSAPVPVDGQYDTLEEVKEAMGKINAKPSTSREAIASAYEVIPDLKDPSDKNLLAVSGEYDVISHEGAPRKKSKDYASLKLGKDGNTSESSAVPGPQTNANHVSPNDEGMTDNILYKPASL